MMGVFVIVAALSSMRANGVIIALRSGILPLAGAESCHYLIALLVPKCIAGSAAEEPDAQAPQTSKDSSEAPCVQEVAVAQVSKVLSSRFEADSEAETCAVESQDSASSNGEATMV